LSLEGGLFYEKTLCQGQTVCDKNGRGKNDTGNHGTNCNVGKNGTISIFWFWGLEQGFRFEDRV